MRFRHMMASAALVALVATAYPASSEAGEILSGVTGTLGGGGNLATAKVDAQVGGVNANVDAKVGSTTTATATVGTSSGTAPLATAKIGTTSAPLSATARATVTHQITARAQALGPKNLLRLCLAVGAKGCDGATRSHQLALIKAKLGNLSGGQLASACVSVGGNCGAALASSGGSGGGGSGSGSGGGGSGGGTGTGGSSVDGHPVNVASSNSDRDMRITCRSVLASPARYESGLVKLCRKIGQ